MPGQYIIEVKTKKNKHSLRTISKTAIVNDPSTSLAPSESGVSQS